MTAPSFPSVLAAGAPTLTLTALLVVLIAAAPAVPEARAQQQHQQRAPGANMQNAPRVITKNPISDAQKRAPGADVRNAPAETQTPPPPGGSDDPDGAPLGGLEWLALAGGAYAANRLRKRGKDDDEGEPGEELP
ncbi:MAG: hypothetical protein BRD44_06460 [Bacteroidetes bacterium QS_7_67_15]|nr:MAG: hypothetical protein BRD44_06460 [Bacteroidetes bacterium QS_7_67_15]